MDSLRKWLHTKPSSYPLHILNLTMMMLIYAISSAVIMTIMEVPPRDWMELENTSVEHRIIFNLILVLLLPINSIVEELAFRAPLSFVCKVFPGHRAGLVAATMSSILFGYIHAGIATIPIQGMIGMILSLSYLKCGGLEGKFLRPYAVTVTIHTLYNFPLVCVGLIAACIEYIAA